MTHAPFAPCPRLNLARLRRRIVWIPTATLSVLIVCDGIFEIVAEEKWNVEIILAHTMLLLLVTGGGLLFSTHTFNSIRRGDEEIHRQRSLLTHAERRSLALLEKSSDLVIILRADATVTYVSPTVTRMLGYPPEAWIGSNILTCIHEEERDAVGERLLALGREAGESHTDMFRVRHQDGTWRWMAAAWTNLLSDPSVEAIVCNARDVSGEKRAQDTLAWQANINAKISELHKSLASTAVPIPEINECILRCARDLTESNHGFLSYIDPALGDNIVFPATPMMPPTASSAAGRGPVIRRDVAGRFPGLRGFPLNTREPFFTNNPTSHPEYLGLPTGHARLVRFLSVPVWMGSDLVGQIAVANSTRDYTDRDLDAVSRVAECYALAIQRRRAEDEVASLARFPADNPHPIMRIGPDGTILYANNSSAGLLTMWAAAVGSPAPAPWPDRIREALATGVMATEDVRCGERVLTFSLFPVKDAGYVNLYGRDITDRIRAEEALRQSEERFRVALSNSPITVFNQDVHLRYTWHHNSAMGLSPEQIVGKTDDELFPAADADRLIALKRRVLDLKVGVREEFSFEHMPHPRHFHLTIEPLRSGSGDVVGITCAAMEITERKRTEEALRTAHADLERRVLDRTEELYTTNVWLQKEIAERRRAENALRAWFDNVPIGLYRTTRSGRILDANPALVQFLGFPDKETLLATSTLALYTDRDDRHRWLDRVEREEFLTGFEASVRRFDGKIIWVRNSARAIRDAEGKVVYYEGGIEDITALKESANELLASREQLRVLAAHLESIREEERTRIAREIHDELGQLLTGLKLDLAWLATRLPTSLEYIREKIRAMSRLADDTIKSVRRIATELRPGILDDLGLTAAIEWQTQEFQARTGIQCEFLARPGNGVEDPERRTALFRILQETLTNVARHAHATRVVVALLAHDDRFELRVEDNGRGITDAEIVNRESLGLLGIRERARLLGGDVHIVGRPGSGTTISVRIPMEHRPAPRVAAPATVG